MLSKAKRKKRKVETKSKKREKRKSRIEGVLAWETRQPRRSPIVVLQNSIWERRTRPSLYLCLRERYQREKEVVMS
jgi:hypothetical protein